MKPQDKKLVDCIRAWHETEHGGASSGAIPDNVQELIESQQVASEAFANIGRMTTEYGNDSEESEGAVAQWLDALAELNKRYDGLRGQFGPEAHANASAPKKSGGDLIPGAVPGRLALGKRAASGQLVPYAQPQYAPQPALQPQSIAPDGQPQYAVQPQAPQPQPQPQRYAAPAPAPVYAPPQQQYAAPPTAAPRQGFSAFRPMQMMPVRFTPGTRPAPAPAPIPAPDGPRLVLYRTR